MSTWEAEFTERFPECARPIDEQLLDVWPVSLKRLAAGHGVPLRGVVASPRSSEEVAAVVRWSGLHDVPVVPRGGGSSVTGSPLPPAGFVLLDTRRLDRIVDIDPVDGLVHVQAGVLGGQLEAALQAEGLTTWFSPQSLERSTVGGWVATRASGQFSSCWGGIEDAVVALTVALANGEIVRVGTPPRGAVGPDLRSLFIGSEGAFGIVTEVTLRVHPWTPVALSTFALADLSSGLTVIRRLMQSGARRPALLRLYDEDEARHLELPSPGASPVLIAGFAGQEEEEIAAAEQRVARRLLSEAGAEDLGPGAAEAWFKNRYDFSRLEAFLNKPGGFAETIEVAFAWRSAHGSYCTLKEALRPCADEVVGHFSHAYSDGVSCYLITTGELDSDQAALDRLEHIWSVAMETALGCGAVISHHHGVGTARLPYLPRQLGAAYELLVTLKQAFDPGKLCHPGSLVDLAGEGGPRCTP